MKKKPKHPMQRLYRDKQGTVRFQPNAIVRYLLDIGLLDLNKIATLPFDRADHEQLAQLMGYSLSGFGELSYVRDSTYARAERLARNLDHPAESKQKKYEEALRALLANTAPGTASNFCDKKDGEVHTDREHYEAHLRTLHTFIQATLEEKEDAL